MAPAAHSKDGGDLLGEVMPDHARPSLQRALGVAAVWLPLWLAPVALLLLLAGPADIFARLAMFFSKVAVVSFGGAYAVLAYVAQQAVAQFHWVAPGEMLSGQLIAVDGDAVKPITVRRFPLASAQRADILLRLPGAGAMLVNTVCSITLARHRTHRVLTH